MGTCWIKWFNSCNRVKWIISSYLKPKQGAKPVPIGFTKEIYDEIKRQTKLVTSYWSLTIIILNEFQSNSAIDY